MKSPLKVALLAAVPIELVNFFALYYRDGSPLPPQWFARSLDIQWIFIHWLGHLALKALYHITSSALWEMVGFLLGGYCETVLVLLVLLYALRGLRHHYAHAHAVHN